MNIKNVIKQGKELKKFLKEKREIFKNRWLFSSTGNTAFNYNSKYLFEYVLKHYSDIIPFYVINDETKRAELNAEYKTDCFINTNTEEGIKKALSCKVWFTSAGLPIYARNLHRHYMIINLWHGIPLKKIALEDKNLNFIKRLLFNEIFSKNYTYVITSSKSLDDIMQKSFNVPPCKIKIWGQPRCDRLFDENETKEVLHGLFSREFDFKRLILYAPTFRNDEAVRLFPFDDFDYEGLNSYLKETKTYIFLRKHTAEKCDVSPYLSDNILDISMLDDICEILNIFDILITDYSSIYVDYLKLNRPIVFLPYDKATYLKKRGFNFNLEEMMPGSIPLSFDEFLTALDTDDYELERKRVLEILDTTGNNACETVCRGVIDELI